MQKNKRIWLVIGLVCLFVLVVGSIASSVNAVRSMQTAVTVDSLEQALDATPTPLGFAVPTETPSSPATASPDLTQSASASTSFFIAMLAELPQDDSPGSHTGYDRDYFDAWIDADGDGCNTRAEVLLMESQTTVSTRGRCTVITGSWVSVYDGAVLTDAGSLDIDHFVPLNEAWVSGAYAWDGATRVQFGNDLGYGPSLVAVTASSNRSKSDQDPARWMPPARGYFCDYAATWVAVKWRWSLSVDSLERMSLQSVLNGCASVSVEIPQKATITTGAAPEPVAPVSDGALDPNYGTCSLAQANGAGPYVQGIDPEYEWYRDRDKDGVVCE